MEVIQQPFAPLQDEIHEEDSWSQPGRSQTFESAESWPEIDAEAMQLFKQLDSLAGDAVFDPLKLPSVLPIPKPRRVHFVTAALMDQLGGVSQVAEVVGMTSILMGGGRQASASRGALQVEQRAEAGSKLTAARVQGVIEVVACDQLKVARGDSIGAILSDEEKVEALRPAFQQVPLLCKLSVGMNALLLAWSSLGDGCNACLVLLLDHDFVWEDAGIFLLSGRGSRPLCSD